MVMRKLPFTIVYLLGIANPVLGEDLGPLGRGRAQKELAQMAQ